MPAHAQIRQRSSVGLAALLLIARSSTASAQHDTHAPASLELDWQAPAECPSRERILQRVDAILGQSPGNVRRVIATARVEPNPNGQYEVTISATIDGEPGERALAAESCSALSDATVLILALFVNPNASIRAPEPEPPVPPKPPSEPPPPKAAAREPPPTAVVADPLLALSVSVAGDVGSLPLPGVGAELALALTPGRFRIEVLADLWAPQSVFSLEYPDAGARMQRIDAGLRLAYTWKLGSFGLGPTAGATIDHLWAGGFGGREAFDQEATWASVTAGFFGDWSPARWFSLRLTVGAKIPTSHPSFVLVEEPVGTTTVLHEVGPVSGEARFGCGFHFL